MLPVNFILTWFVRSIRNIDEKETDYGMIHFTGRKHAVGCVDICIDSNINNGKSHLITLMKCDSTQAVFK